MSFTDWLSHAGGTALGTVGKVLSPLDYPRQALSNLADKGGKILSGDGSWDDALGMIPGVLGAGLAGGLMATGVGAPLGILAGSALGGLAQGVGQGINEKKFRARSTDEIAQGMGIDTEEFGGKVASFGLGMATDPLTYAGGLGGLLPKGWKGAKAIKGNPLAPATQAETRLAAPVARVEVPEIQAARPIEGSPLAPAQMPTKAANEGPWFSRLEKAVENMPGNQWKSQGLLNQIRKAGGALGVGNEEIELRKLADLVAANPTVTREQLVKHLKDNPVGLTETVQRQAGKLTAAEEAELRTLTTTVPRTPQQRHRYEDLVRRAQAMDEEAPFSQYVADPASAQNYRNILLQRETSPELRELQAEYNALMGNDMSPTLSGEESARLSAVANELQGKEYIGPHFQEPNVLAHLRMTDRTGPSGEKLAHLEELQSDLHQSAAQQAQAAKDKVKELEKELADYGPGGTSSATPEMIASTQKDLATAREEAKGPFYKTQQLEERKAAMNSELDAVRRELDELDQRMNQVPFDSHAASEIRRRKSALLNKNYTLQDKIRDADAAAPDFPFKESWPELGMKRALYEAAKGGADRLTWNHGEVIQGIVGGELGGQQQFYDKTMKDIAAKLGKKHGVKPDLFEFGKSGRAISPELKQELQTIFDAKHRGMDQFRGHWGNPDMLAKDVLAGKQIHPYDVEDIGQDLIDRIKSEGAPAPFSAHSLPLTPQMREQIVHEGMPMMSRRGTPKKVPEQPQLALQVPAPDGGGSPYGTGKVAGTIEWKLKDKFEAAHPNASAEEIEQLVRTEIDKMDGQWAVMADSTHAEMAGLHSRFKSESEAHSEMMRLKQKHRYSGVDFFVSRQPSNGGTPMPSRTGTPTEGRLASLTRADRGQVSPEAIASPARPLENVLAPARGGPTRIGDLLDARRQFPIAKDVEGYGDMAGKTLGPHRTVGPTDLGDAESVALDAMNLGDLGRYDPNLNAAAQIKSDLGAAADRGTVRHEGIHGIVQNAAASGNTEALPFLMKMAAEMKATRPGKFKGTLADIIGELAAQSGEFKGPLKQTLSGTGFLFDIPFHKRHKEYRDAYRKVFGETSPAAASLYEALGMSPYAAAAGVGAGMGTGAIVNAAQGE